MVAIVIISLWEVRVPILLITIQQLKTPDLVGPAFMEPIIPSDLGWHYCYFLLDTEPSFVWICGDHVLRGI